MECELCGRKTGELFLVEVEGVKLQVCRNCTKHGKFICKVREPKPVQTRKVNEQPAEKEIMLAPDYGDRIRKKRNKLGLKREDLAKKLNETESVIRRLEHGDMVPDDKLVNKIEKTLRIKLREEYEPVKTSEKRESQTLTLGDIVKIKK